MASVADGGSATRRPEQVAGLPMSSGRASRMASGRWRRPAACGRTGTGARDAGDPAAACAVAARREFVTRAADPGPAGRGGRLPQRDHAVMVSVLAEARAAEDPVVLAEALSLAHHFLLTPALAATGPSMTVNHGSVSIAVPGPNDSLRFCWPVNGSATW